MGTNPNWPDRNGSAGGMGPDGHAVRHSEPQLNVALPALGWLSNQGATSNPRGGGWTKIGMNSAVGVQRSSPARWAKRRADADD
jgi:hypothetical protein